MLREMIDPLRVGRPSRAATFVVVVISAFYMVGLKQVRASGILLRSGEGDAIKKDADENKPTDEEIADGKLENAKSTDAINVKHETDAEDLALWTQNPTNAPHVTLVPRKKEGEKVAFVARNPSEGPMIRLYNATERKEDGRPAVAQVAASTLSSIMESEVTNRPTMTTDIPTDVATTTKPTLRTEEAGAIISEPITSDDLRTQASRYMNQDRTLVFVAMASICCIFLFVWGRKRRLSATFSSGTSGGTSSKELKVQYTQVPDEQPLNRSHNDDNEYCEDYEEDVFTNDQDNWDDWEDESAQTQLNPFAAAPRAPHLTTLRYSKATQPLPPLPQQHAQLREDAVAVTGIVSLSSVESNSSSDSFEVVTDMVNTAPTSSHSAAADAEKESDSIDNLFSQFGMVLPFKKRVTVPTLPAATTAAPIAQSPVTAADPAMSSLPPAAEASVLFAAEMDDELTAVDAADEWGEDDEWVKSI